MLKYGCALFVAVAPFMGVPQAFAKVVTVDKGHVLLDFAESSEETIDAKYKDGCLAKISSANSASALNVKHSSESCPSGAEILLGLKKNQNYEFSLAGGLLTIENAGKFLSEFSSVETVVTGGYIQSDVSEIQVKPGNAPATAVYKNKISSLPTLTLKVSGGMVQFKE